MKASHTAFTTPLFNTGPVLILASQSFMWQTKRK